MSEHVHRMFSEIAPRYDLTNSVLSFGVHHLWRRAAVKASQAKAGDKVLDCATGTGDLAIAFAHAVSSSGKVTATDFCEEMMTTAPSKATRSGVSIDFKRADAMALPFERQTFDVSSIAFGIRNVDDPRKCLSEMARVVKTGGRVVVLEFGQPKGIFGALFRFYSRFVMPWVGKLLTGSRAAYEYLPKTSAAFPSGNDFLAIMKSTKQLKNLQATPLWFGTAYIYVAEVE